METPHTAPTAAQIRELVAALQAAAAGLGELRLMEVCGSHTMAIARAGLRRLLPENLTLLSGPGCPVCVTGTAYVDQALALAHRPGVTVTTFGDLVRVPGGGNQSLDQARAAGAAVKIVLSPLDALALARSQPERQIVFLGIGFETTAPGVALAVREAAASGVANFSVLCGHKTMPQALRALAAAGGPAGFLLPGHVSAVTGTGLFGFLPEEFGRGGVVAGFSPADILAGLLLLVRQLRQHQPRIENAYPQAVRAGGNPAALKMMAETFAPADAAWRGLGVIPGSGLCLRDAFHAQDAARRFGLDPGADREPPGCRCGEVLRGAATPRDCPLFGTACTPQRPVGACMVSSEGACAASYLYE
ncbi:MAG: hydrogenase formation protein HypD [Lentisphaeria bacterium]